MNRKAVEILAVDRAFTPDRWIGAQTALNYYSRGLVQASFGETAMTLHGGINHETGRQSILEVGSILVIDTKSHVVKDFQYAPFERSLLFKRDRCTCAYCGDSFRESILTMDHVLPACQGGADSWENLVTACKDCNQRKAGRTPEQARMELLYVPFRPNRFEYLILSGRNILADQMDFLKSRLGKNSRLL